MKDTNFFTALRNAFSLLDRDSKGLFRTASTRQFHEALTKRCARKLRRQAAKLTELDVDVMEDLMKIVKKLSKHSQGEEPEAEDRIKLTLKMIDLVLDKARPPTPDHLLYLFNYLYHGVDKIIPNKAPLPMKKQVAA